MILQPTLQGPQITLLPLTTGDFENSYKVASDPLLWEQHPKSNRYLLEEFQSFFQKAIESKGALKVIDNQTSKIIGGSRFYELDEQNKTIMIGYTFLERKYWGGKYNQEMKYLMLNHAFQFVDAVLFQIGEVNIRSQKAVEKIGGHLLKKFILEGDPYRIYEIRKIDWKF